jgi:hypothetical protein
VERLNYNSWYAKTRAMAFQPSSTPVFERASLPDAIICWGLWPPERNTIWCFWSRQVSDSKQHLLRPGECVSS